MVPARLLDASARPQVKGLADVLGQPVRAGPVRLVDHEDVGDLHQARLHRLHGVTRLGDQHHDDGVRCRRDLQLGLPDPHRLDQHALEAEGVHQVDDLLGRRREPPQRATRGHGANEDPRIGGEVVHANAVPEQRSTGVGRSRVDGHDAHAIVPAPVHIGKLGQEARLPGPRRAGKPYSGGVRLPLQQKVEQILEAHALVFRHGDRPGERRHVSVAESSDKIGELSGGLRWHTAPAVGRSPAEGAPSSGTLHHRTPRLES